MEPIMGYDYHIPVLRDTSVDALITNPSGVYVDVTYGAGGHSLQILKKLDDKARLYAFDQDADAIANELEDARFVLIKSNFAYIKRFMRFYGIEKVDGVLADLGVSSHQIDTADRGFSYRFDADLDMRMNNQTELTAETILNHYDLNDLTKMFRMYGDVPNARKLSNLIIQRRETAAFKLITDLLEVTDKCLVSKRAKYLAKVFQAIRMEVNDEISVLKHMLEDAAELLRPGGRLVVISYHSLEDRLVKNLIKKGNINGVAEHKDKGGIKLVLKDVGKGVILPDEEEQERNSRSRSAKMRVGEKL